MATERFPSDSQLVEAVRRGDRDAAAELIRRHAEGVLLLLTRVLLNRDLAQDLAQETFLRVFRKLGSFEQGRSFRPWVRTIAWNLARDHFRRNKRRGTRVEFPLQGEVSRESDQGFCYEPRDHREELPEDRLHRREEGEMVHRALRQLSPRSRVVLVLRDLEGLSYQEVARVLGCRPGTAKSRVNRARIEFRDVYLRLSPSHKEL